jgi:hypothetical protein
VKILFKDEHLSLLREINAPYDINKDYSDDEFLDLEEFIIDYAMYHEYTGDGMTQKGQKILDIVVHMADPVNQRVATVMPELVSSLA